MGNQSDEIVVKLTPPAGVRCPRCGGLGNLQDGSCSISGDEFHMRPATKCSRCDGSGRIPDPDEEIARLNAELRELREKDRGIPANCSRCPYCTAVREDQNLAAHITDYCPQNPLRTALEEAARREKAPN